MMSVIEHRQVFGLRSAELGDRPGEAHDFILVSDADEYVREVERLSRELAGAVEALERVAAPGAVTDAIGRARVVIAREWLAANGYPITWGQ